MLLRNLSKRGSGFTLRINTANCRPGEIVEINVFSDISKRNSHQTQFNVAIEADRHVEIVPITDHQPPADGRPSKPAGH